MLEFRETDLFTVQITRLLSDEEYAELQGALVVRPDAGDLVEDTGGLRKVRWSQQARGKGKRGGIRVIYYWRVSESLITCCSPIRKMNKMIYRHVRRGFLPHW